MNRLRASRSITSLTCLALLGFVAAIAPSSARAQGVNQPTFSAGQVGTIVFTFNQTLVGDRVTIGDFQHGQLYLASGSAGFNVRDSWWNLTNPLAPVLIQSQVTSHDKPHNIGFWGNFFTEAVNGTALRVWNYTTRAQVGSINGSVNSIWDTVQAPFIYTGSHGYSTGSKIEIWNVANPAAITKLGEVDTAATIGFQVGASSAIGNLLICSATEAPGVAVFDISDPASPVLLDSRVDGTSLTYTSLAYGTRIFNAERTGIRVYDFSNPANIQLVGTIPTGGTPRYLVFKDGKGYCATGSQNIRVFDTTTLAITQTFTPDGKIMDFVFPMGNMMVVAGGGAGGSGSTNGARIMALQQTPDTTGPSVVYANPVSNAVNVSVKSRIGMSMSDQISVTSLTTNNFIVRPVGTTTPIPGTYSTMMGLINFSPASPLQPGTTYEAILTAGGVKDVVGNGIPAQFRTTFTTLAAVVDPDGVTHRWPLDGNFNDVVGANNGANTGVTFTNGVAGQAGLFDGADFVNVGTINLSNSFTLSSWVWVDSTATNAQTIMANSPGGSASAGFRWYVNTFNTTDRAIVFETGNGTAGNSARTSTGAVNLGAWNHLAVVVNRTAGTANLYVNGTNLTTDASILTDFTVNAAIHLGQFTGNSSRLRGRLDEARTYGKQLSVAEISDLISVNHRWPLDGNFTDTAGSNNGVNTGVTFTTGRVGTQSGVFDGADFVNVGALNLGNAFTISAWVWPNTGSTNIQSIIANCPGGSTANGFKLFINTFNTSDGAVVLENGNGTTGNSGKSAGGVIRTGAWNHVAVTINRTGGTAVFYVNGTNVTADGAIATDFGNNAITHLGQFTNNTWRLNGRLDDVRTYNRVLSATEVTAIATAAGNAVPVIASMTTSPNPAPINTSVTFTLNATDANGDGLSYSFDFGDGGGQGAFTGSSTAAHTYVNPGRYTVIGRVRDSLATVTTNRIEIIHLPLTATKPNASSQIIYDASRNKVWNVNPDSDTVTRVDGISLAKDFEISVGTEPRTLALRPNNSEIWVACETSDEIHVLSATNGAALQTISTPRGSRPMGIAFSPNGNIAYVTYMNSGLLARFNPTNKTLIGTLAVGPTPRAVAVSGDSSRVFVGRFVSPVNVATPSAEVGEVREIAASTFTVTRTFTLAHDTSADTENSGRGTPNYLVQMAIAPDGQRLFVPSKKDNVDRGEFRDTQELDHDNTVRSIFSKLNLVTNVEDTAGRRDVDNQELPHGVAFSPVGDLAFIAYQGNNEVLVFNSYSGNQVTGFDVGTQLAPQDLVLKPDGTRLYVLNFMTRSVSAFGITNIINGTSSSATSLGTVSVVATELLSAQVLQGKKIFYNAADQRMTSEGYISCATCHLDGGSDQRVWDFTDRGEGFRNTVTLDGRRGTGQGNVHWTANFDEIQDFELDIRNGFKGTGFITNGTPNGSLGAPNAGRSADLDALAAYVASLSKFNRSPHRNSDGTLTSDAIAGRALFVQLNCISCHSGTEFSDSIVGASPVLHNVGTIKSWSGQRMGQPLTGFDTPTLKGLWSSAPYLHDGSAATLLDVITTQNTNNLHGSTSALTTTQRNQLVAYLQQIDDLEVNGMTHLWSFESNFNDSVGTNHGVNTGVTFISGQVGQSGVFDGADSVNLGVMNVGNSFTIASWVWVDTTATNIQTLMANSAGGFAAAGYRLFVNTFNTADRAVCLETGNGTAGNGGKSTTGVITFGAWNHVAVVVNRTAGQATFYVNGANVTADSSITTNFTTSATNHLGQMVGGSNRLRGRLDETAIYNRALSADEVSVLFGGDSFAMMMMGGGGGSFMMSGGAESEGSEGGSSSSLTLPWQAQDTGAVGATGSASHDNGTFTVAGAGADIWGTADAFQFVYQTATGDCDIRARVASLSNSDAWAKAGVMIRETLNANAANAAMVVTPGQGAFSQLRATTGGTTAATTTSGIAAPAWVRVQRVGNTFTTFTSTNGSSWTTVNSVTIQMGSTVYIGLGVTSHVVGQLTDATFDNVSATP